MKWLVILFGFGLIMLSISGIVKNVSYIETLKTGRKVQAIIIELPKTCYTKRNSCKLKYGNIIFSLPISSDFCMTSKVGDTTTVMQSTRKLDEFVFDGSSGRFNVEIASDFLLILVGVVFLVYSSKIARGW